jgi:AraC-like DNA-binding protein
MTQFGPWSTTLAIGAAFGLAVALMLALTRSNAVANRLLALLLLTFVLKLMPYALGFAGYYDAYPWLSFAPFSVGLAIGPLLYLHVHRLTSAALPRRWWRHLLPGIAQFIYYIVVFAQPLAFKNAWNDSIHRDWIDPAETFVGLLSFAIYLWLSLRAYRGYQSWLDAHLSNREEFRIVWLRNVLFAFALAWPVWAVYETLSYTIDFNYYQRFPLYVFFTLLVFYLALEGWRHAGTVYPQAEQLERAERRAPAAARFERAPAALVGADMELFEPAQVEPAQIEPARPEGTRPEPSERDWSAQGRQWLQMVEAAGWWRDPDLSLERLARHLGTNTAYLSRALNEGMHLSFNEAINRLRVAEVCRRLDGNDGNADILDIAFAAGFSSKTSFNRVFKSQIGKTPSHYRESAITASTEG